MGHGKYYCLSSVSVESGEFAGPSVALQTLEELSERIELDLADACMADEFNAKNAVTEDGGYAGIGRDLARYLPGVYWVNFYGQAYCDFTGRDRLLSAPAYATREVGGGVLVRLSERPQDWNTPEYKDRERRFLDHVGREHFFEREDPDKPTKSPWRFPKTQLPQRGPIRVKDLGGGKYEILDPDIREALGGDAILDPDRG